MSELLRSEAQSRRMWAMLNDVAKQVRWPVDGELQHLSAEDWKDIISASLTQQRVAKGMTGGFVMLGQRTRNMTKAQMGDLMTIIADFGARQGVRWSDPTTPPIEAYEA